MGDIVESAFSQISSRKFCFDSKVAALKEYNSVFYSLCHVLYADLGTGTIMVKKTESLYIEVIS